MSRLSELLKEIRALEDRVADEVAKEADELGYSIKRGRVFFEREISSKHRQFTKRLSDYFSESSWPGLLVSPIVYSLIIPVVIFDIMIFIYQLICLPVYKIPKVRRSDYIVIDHHKLQYLNYIERFNCVYCSYAGGIIAYVQEVAARSELYWCPIKHSQRVENTHSHYHDFLPYGDAEAYVNELKNLRDKVKKLND